MTILLVDDEQPIRDYLRTLVDWKKYGFELFEAENGKAAIEIMQKRHIDLLLLDIAMPIMNGLEVVAQLHSLEYNCIISFLTSHDEFEFAQKALRVGCFDYILKSNITSESILELVKRMAGVASEDARQSIKFTSLETAARRKEQLELQTRVKYWLNNQDEPSIEKFFSKNLGFNDAIHRYALLAVNIVDYAEIVRRYSGNDIVQFSVIFDGVLCELLEEHNFFYVQTDDGMFVIFLRFDKTQGAPRALQKTKELVTNIDQSFRNILKINSSIIFTQPYLGIENSREFYTKAIALFDTKFYLDEEQITDLSDFVLDKEICDKLIADFSLRLSESLQSRTFLNIELCINSFIQAIVDNHYAIAPIDFIKIFEKAFTDFCAQTQQDLAALNLRTQNSANELKAEFLEQIKPMCIPDKAKDKNFLVKKAVLLIQQNYKEDIGLEWLAEQLWVNSSYLCRLFSQEIGQPFTQYLNNFRVEKAKEIIRQSNLKLYEIAESSGFSSAIVFSNVFKKITGETPSEYKKHFL